MARKVGWVPRQHGAWAMLVVPYGAGVILRARSETLAWHLVPLLAFWLLGYFAFNAVSQWLKAPPKRRQQFVRPTVVYAGASAVMGLATLALAGWGILGWAPFYVPLLLPALWLAAQHHERATIGGALTIAAASLMLLVARYDSPAGLLADPGMVGTLIVTALVFAYFFGTVLYVKTNIRERGNPRFMVASVGWHAAATVVALLLVPGFGVAWWWTAFFAATTLRAAIVPGRHFTPLQIGLVEVALSTALVLGIAFG